MAKLRELKSVLNLTVIVAGLGYFVDLFDITLYGVVRVASLTDIGVPADKLLSAGIFIYNAQMAGMMLGGLIWGIMGDKRGRLSVMFGSILLYSLANLANIFVWDTNSYALCRFVGGVGLAGELGAAITLVSESLPKEKRGLGTTVVATLGMLGIVAAAFIGQVLPWKVAYLLGGIMGLALLLTRFKMSESAIFAHTRASQIDRGNFFLLLSPGRLVKYLACIVIGIPIYFTTGVLFTFAPELTKGLGVEGISAGNAILFGSVGLTLGDLFAGLFSQWLGSRKKAVATNLVAGFALAGVYTLAGHHLGASGIYAVCLLIGITVGYWAVLVTMAAEQFGTNIRATAATTVPNFVRGSAVFAVSAFGYLKGELSASNAAFIVAATCFGLALLALTRIDETFHRDLSYEEPAAGVRLQLNTTARSGSSSSIVNR